MIRLTKGPTPQILQTNADAWTQTLKDRRRLGQAPTVAEKHRYRHPDIKVALIEETFGKCAYCESKVRHIAHGDAEHIVPKSTNLEKTFDWTNLTLACELCNGNKGTHFGNHEDLVDPYVVEPSMHFDFRGAMVLPKPGSAPGFATESIIKLNRTSLLERRAERMNNLFRQLHLLAVAPDANTRAVLQRDLEMNETAKEKEYSAMARAYIAEQIGRLANGPVGTANQPPGGLGIESVT